MLSQQIHRPGSAMKSGTPKKLRPQTTIERRLTAADPALGRVVAAVIARIGRQRIAPSRATPFQALVRAVVYQSVSGKAGALIFARLEAAAGKPLTPARIIAQQPKSLARAGLSSAKVRTIRGLAAWFASNVARAKALPTLSDREIAETLGAIPGIGVWTANVFMIFNLGRIDVMPAADLGIRRGVQLADGSRMMATPAEVLERSQKWSPYRSIASIYLWQAGKLKLGPDDLRPAPK
jgi:DNA-3-methyladenine glycosylase II